MNCQAIYLIHSKESTSLSASMCYQGNYKLCLSVGWVVKSHHISITAKYNLSGRINLLPSLLYHNSDFYRHDMDQSGFFICTLTGNSGYFHAVFTSLWLQFQLIS